ncbi:unnamed protein product [Miscanthus lutarioriparius]|uniref:DUF4220 domain-containing protein n=1 Tax=Miscanthus lutarioriparius TaxID=422564 RepID=A0A811QCY0_9POAL|nr:unnamed protein product [Miscanthus lutarioriparius]
MAAIASFLLEADHARVLASARPSRSRPHGVDAGGHRYVFWLVSDTLARAVGLFGSRMAIAVSATGDAEAELALPISKEYAGLWNATASVRLVVVAPPSEAPVSSVAAGNVGEVRELADEGASPQRLFMMACYVGGAEECATTAKSGKLRERVRQRGVGDQGRPRLFMLQVTLVILAEFRRCIDSGMLRIFVWSAYMAADATAIYVLGHMSVTSRSPEHELMAFWAPFLLMHLGGQDSITAYAIEDNRLWLRHLQTLAVQAAAAGYVLYESFAGSLSTTLLRWGTVIMFMVGVVKYGERVWALKCASSSPQGKNYRMFQNINMMYKTDRYLQKVVSGGPMDTEAYLMMAQQILDVPMDLLKGLQTRVLGDSNPYKLHTDLREEGRLYKVVELQISLMYDVFYTKAEVLHGNLYGLCIRMLLAMATTAAFLLFHLLIVLGYHRRHYNKVDVAITYVLLAGAVVLETASLLRAMFSSWTCALLIRWMKRNETYERTTTKHSRLTLFFVCNLMRVRRLIHVADWRFSCSWSRSMGQHSLLRVCTRSITSRRSKIARWMEAEDWWNTLAYSWSIPVSAFIEKVLMDKVLSSCEDGDGDQYFDSRGQKELKQRGLYEQEGLDWSLENRIIVWHMATSIYLSWWHKKQAEARTTETTALPMAQAVEVLSNYMMFLLASRPHMLPPTASRNAYVEICYVLTSIRGGHGHSTVEDLVGELRSIADALERMPTIRGQLEARLRASCALGAMLIGEGEAEESRGQENKALELLAQVWVEAMCYAAQRCSAYSHAKQLSNGGELITVAALLLEHTKKIIVIDNTTDTELFNHEKFGAPLHGMES